MSAPAMQDPSSSTNVAKRSDAFEQLAERIESSTALVGVVGLGYVGLPLAHALHQGGMPVLGFDIDSSKITDLESGRSYLKHLGSDMFQTLAKSDRFAATTDFDRLDEPDVILIGVPTPLGQHGNPDLSYVLNTAEAIGKRLRKGQLIVLESTTYPGTTRDDFLPALQAAASHATDLRPGRDYFLAFSPEREDPGRSSHSTSTIPKLVGGLDEPSTTLAASLYRKGVDQVVPVRSAEVAEAAKLLENIFRSINIAMVNEMKMILADLGIDIWEVVRAASTKPFGFMPFYPGPGLGGHCIPIDPFYLSWKAKEVGRPTRFIELAGEINTRMPRYVVDRLAEALNDDAKPVKGSKVLVLGLAYKPNVDDTRESPSFELIELLRERGAAVSYSDPHVRAAAPTRKHDLGMTSVALSPDVLAGADAVLIATNHDAFDYELVAQHAQLIIDTRDAMRPYESQVAGRLVRA